MDCSTTKRYGSDMIYTKPTLHLNQLSYLPNSLAENEDGGRIGMGQQALQPIRSVVACEIHQWRQPMAKAVRSHGLLSHSTVNQAKLPISNNAVKVLCLPW